MDESRDPDRTPVVGMHYGGSDLARSLQDLAMFHGQAAVNCAAAARDVDRLESGALRSYLVSVVERIRAQRDLLGDFATQIEHVTRSMKP